MSSRHAPVVSAASDNRDAGFTLIEIVVALALLALMIAMLPATLHMGRRAWETGDLIERREDLFAARSFLERTLGEAMPVYARLPSGGTGIAFRGDPASLEFVAPSSAGPAGGGLYRYALWSTRSQESPNALFLSANPFQVGPSAPPGAPAAPETRILVRRLDAARLRYFGRVSRQQDAPQWTDTWDRNDALPDLVELSLVGVDGQTPPPLVVELKLRHAGS